jgi:hypothetical protein
MSRENRIVDSPCFYKAGLVADDDGKPLGHVVDVAYAPSGWRVLVVTKGGELRDLPIDAVTMSSAAPPAPEGKKAGDAKMT